MPRHSFAFLAATALAAGAMPAAAQDGTDGEVTYQPPAAVPEQYQAEYCEAHPLPEQGVVPCPGAYPAPPPEGYPAPPAGYPLPPEAYGVPQAAYPHAPGTYPHAPGTYPAAPGLPPRPDLGYTQADRDAWLDDCRSAYYGEGKKRGGFFGGLLGAIAGGVVGNRVSDDHRLAGTLIGAGVGGIAGIAIGAAIGAAGDREDIDECEAYLLRYEAGYGSGYPAPAQGYGYGYGYPAYPAYAYQVVMVPVTYRTNYIYSAPVRHEEEVVDEEWVDEEVIETRQVPAPQPTKYVKDKRIRYTK